MAPAASPVAPAPTAGPLAGPGPARPSPAWGGHTTFRGPGWAPPPEPPPVFKKKHSVGIYVVPALVALVVGAVVYYGFLGRVHVQVPDSLAGEQRIESPAAAEFVNRIHKLGQEANVSADAAVYGHHGVGTFYVMVFGTGRDSTAPDSIFKQFAAGFASTSTNTVIYTAKLTHASRNGASYMCAPVRGALSGAICMWKDSGTVGFVQAIGIGIEHDMDLAETARLSIKR
jgi:hypothetical protein